MISVTTLAVDKLRGVLEENQKPDSSVRVIVDASHGGVQYMLSLEDEAKVDDTVIQADGLKFLVDADSAELVDGAEIDYVEGLMRSGFVISNPNFSTGGGGGCACGGNCGCGGGH